MGSSGHEGVGAPDAVPPLAPTMSLIPRGHRGTPQLYAHPCGGNSPQLSPFALAREPVVPATRSILRLLRPSAPTPGPGDPHATLIPRLDRDSLAALTRNRCPVHSGCQRGKVTARFWRTKPDKVGVLFPRTKKAPAGARPGRDFCAMQKLERRKGRGGV